MEEDARAYIVEIILALEFLHKSGIVYRDLKPENVVLTTDGHIKLTETGIRKLPANILLDEKYQSENLAYLPPEILKNQPYDKSTDWYCLGVLLFELLIGEAPYYKQTKEDMIENIMTGPLNFPDSVSMEARDFIFKLMQRSPSKRLGSSERDADELKAHKFFEGIDWIIAKNG